MGLNEKNKLKDNQSIAIKLDCPNPITFRNHHAKSSGTIKIYYLFINTESRLTLYCLIKKTFDSSTSLDDDMEMITMSSYPSMKLPSWPYLSSLLEGGNGALHL